MRASADRTAMVTTFDGSILATAAVSAPEVMIKLVNPTLDCFGELPAEQRDVLFQTFEAWLENDASISAAGEALFCHPNTVRHRLRRIENKRADRFPVQGMSPNYVWHSKCIASSCTDDPQTTAVTRVHPPRP